MLLLLELGAVSSLSVCQDGSLATEQDQRYCAKSFQHKLRHQMADLSGLDSPLKLVLLHLYQNHRNHLHLGWRLGQARKSTSLKPGITIITA